MVWNDRRYKFQWRAEPARLGVCAKAPITSSGIGRIESDPAGAVLIRACRRSFLRGALLGLAAFALPVKFAKTEDSTIIVIDGWIISLEDLIRSNKKL